MLAAGGIVTLLDPPILSDTDHEAFYFEGAPERVHIDDDSGLRCWCGHEVVNTINEDFGDYPTGWAHVGCE
jgi:hypothetical protein